VVEDIAIKARWEAQLTEDSQPGVTGAAFRRSAVSFRPNESRIGTRAGERAAAGDGVEAVWAADPAEGSGDRGDAGGRK